MYKGEREIAAYLQKKKTASLEELAEQLSLNQDSVRRAIESLRAKDFVKLQESEKTALQAEEEYKNYMSVGFPEQSVFIKANKGVGINELNADEKSIGIRWAKTKGFVDIEAGKLKPLKSYDEVKMEIKKLEDAFRSIMANGSCDKLTEDELFRRHLITKKTEKIYAVEYTGKPLSGLEKENELDLNVQAADAAIGKAHPTAMFADRVRDLMAELGFEEMEGELLQSAFWNFDALFQPQDHPARELADTFYVEKETPLPSDKQLVERVKAAHEKGWKYSWQESIAKKTVLRTHTTCLSARYLAALKDKKPRKYFAVGRVFRNEATDYKHLAEFHQIEGIVAWENATFRDLLGILKEIYNKLGFEKIRFRPSYFPYTEPSLEIEVYYEDRKQWMELGGAGMFRPEVSIPLCGIYPVLAWGLSLERPMMLALDLKDIREFYKNDLEFLKNTRMNP
ncbi:MAG: phenylalanine--tRNA ligase subunit alpha [Candidatus Micrarchaeota archaeon]